MKLFSRIFLLFLLSFIISPFQSIYSTEQTDQPAPQSKHYKIAFISKQDDHYEVYSINDDGSDEKRITHNNADAFYPTWSPDGSKLLYLTRQGKKNSIWIVNTDGSDQTQVSEDCDPNFLPAWSPDAAKILFVAKRERRTGIFMIKLDTHEEIRLTDKSVNATTPSWSPDGSKILFVQQNKKKNQIFVMNADGLNSMMLTKEKFECSDPFWSPDGQKIIYKTFPYLGSDSELYIMDCNGENQKHIAATDNYENRYYPGRPIGVAPEKYIQWIPGCTEIAIIRCDSFETVGGHNYPCFSLFMVSSGVENKEQRLTSVGMGKIVIPQWAPDGQKFTVQGKIYIKDPNHGYPTEQVPIKIPAYSVESPAWSPDSSKIAFVGQLKNMSKYFIYVINADGTGMVKLTDSPALYPVWSLNKN